MKTTKRLLGIVLALAMLLTMASFPAFADEGYVYTPKDIVLEAVSLNNNTYSYQYAGPRYIARPANNNIFVNDKVVLPEGGLALKVKPAAVTVGGTSVQPTGLVIDVFQNFAGIWETERTNDGKKRFYFKVEYTDANPNGIITGIYKTAETMHVGGEEGKLDGITLGAEGLWAFGLAYAVHTDGTTTTFCRYNGGGSWYYDTNQGSNAKYKTNPYLFFLDVKAQPTSDDYIVSAPVVSDEVKGIDELKGNFATDPNATGFDEQPYRAYIRTGYGYPDQGASTDFTIKVVKRSVAYVAYKYLPPCVMGFSFELDTPTYIDSITFKIDPDKITYDVYGTMDGENWFPVFQNKTSSGSGQYSFSVGTVAKALRIEFRDLAFTWGDLRNTDLVSFKGKLNALKDLEVAVNVDGELLDTLPTDVNGKVDMASILADYPAGKEEGKYIYKIGDEDVTNTISDYMFTGNAEVTVTKYVEPAGPIVTFIGDKGTIPAEANKDGVYEVPAEYKGNYSFYTDRLYSKKFDVTKPVKDDTTVYVKTIPWEYAGKTVVFPIKKALINVSFATLDNSPIAAPSEALYVGDTLSIPLESYKDVTKWIDEGGELTGLKLQLVRYGSNDTDDADGETINLAMMADVKYTFEKPGIYSIRYTEVESKDSAGTVKTTKNTGYNCIVEVLPKPTSAPTATIAPTTTATGNVVAIYDSKTDASILSDTTKAFKKSYSKASAYTDNTELAINTNMAVATQPVGSTHYLQFNLPSASYVHYIQTSKCPILDYDIYGSLDNENWYFLSSGSGENWFPVKGIAKYVRIYQRSGDTWNTKIEHYQVFGYAIDEATINETPASTWVAEDGTKTEITSVNDLPVAYSSGDKNYAVTGWKVKTANGFANVSLSDIAKMDVEDLGNIQAVVEEIPVKADSLTNSLTAKGEDAKEGKNFGEDAKFINGFYVQGTQIRLPEGEGATYVDGGLRFVNILDNSLITELDELRNAGKVRSYEFGTLAVASTRYTGGDLVIGYNNYTKKVAGERIFARADNFEDAYFKYTVCVTGITEPNYTKDVIVRPYITIELADETTVTLYGQQYQTSLYAAADFAIDKDPNLTQEERTHLQGIVDAVK